MNRPSDEEIFKRDGFKCVYCGHDGTTFEGWRFLQVDHFKPRARGGDANDPINLVTSCVICNNMKGAQVFQNLEEAKRTIGSYNRQMREYWEKNVKCLP